MKTLKKSMAALALSFAAVSYMNYAQAAIVEPFTGGQLSAPGWSTGIGADASTYINNAAPDGTYGIALSEGVWSYNTSIQLFAGDTLSAWVNPGPSPDVNPDAQGGRLYLGFDAGSTGAYSFVAASDTNELGFQNNAGYTTPSFTSSATQDYQDQWYLLTINLSSTGNSATANLYGADGITLLSTLTASGLTSTDTGIALRGIGGAAVTSLAIIPAPVPAAIWLFAPISGWLLMFCRRRNS